MSSDEQIIKGCKKGKRHAFNMLYKKYASDMLGICLRYSRDKAEAEDVLQEGFIKVFRKIETFEGRGSFKNWLIKIMVNTAINFYKANKKHDRDEQFDVENKDHAEVEYYDEGSFEIDYDFKSEDLMQMINDLPDGYRMVFNLYVFEGMSHQEIAQIMEIAVSTSKSQLSKARKYLRKKVEEKQKKMIDA
jgi:RNA polymerase sigma-70 factor, ECF subfamily